MTPLFTVTAARVLTVSAALALSSSISGCSSRAAQAITPHTAVRVAAATAGPASPAIVTNGVVANKDEMRLSFKVSGVIRRIYVEQGVAVHAGQKLAEIEQTEINAQLEQSRALAEKAHRDLARGERLYADQVISLEQLQDLRTQDATAQAQLKSVEFNRGYAFITAPGDGVVLRKLAQERELVPAGQAVLLVGAHGRGYVVRADLADRELVQLKLGDPAEVHLDAYPQASITGTLSEIASAADEKTGMFPVEIRLQTLPGALASGLVAKLRLLPAAGRARELTYVPVGAVVEGAGDRASVYVLDGKYARRREVHVAFIDASGAVALASGVSPGERVVTDGALYLDNDDLVDVVADGPRLAATADLAAR
jgi:RND family efflux transporter MFP subunit